MSSLQERAEIGVSPDDPVVLASVLKVPVGLEFYDRVETGRLDPSLPVHIDDSSRTSGPSGISRFSHPARIALRDLAALMLTVSDNAATDAIIDAVGLESDTSRLRRLRCPMTVIEANVKTMLDGVAIDLGHQSYDELSRAIDVDSDTGLSLRSRVNDELDSCRALSPLTTSRSTPREMTRLLGAIYREQAGTPKACRALLKEMGSGTRISTGLPDGTKAATKSGSLFGRVRNDVGLVTYPDGRAYAVAVFARAYEPFSNGPAIEASIGRATRVALDVLRGI